MQLYNGQRVIANTYTNDGKPGFMHDPTRGVTADQVLSGQVPLQPQAIFVDRPRHADALCVAEHDRLPEAAE